MSCRLLLVCGSQASAGQTPFGEIITLLQEFISKEQTETLDYEQVTKTSEDDAPVRLAATLAIVELSSQHPGVSAVVRRIRQQNPTAKIVCYFEGAKNPQVQSAAIGWGANAFVLIPAGERNAHRLIADSARSLLRPAA